MMSTTINDEFDCLRNRNMRRRHGAYFNTRLKAHRLVKLFDFFLLARQNAHRVFDFP